MTLISVDKEQGLATDHGQYYRGDDSDKAVNVIVDVAVTEGLLSLYWKVNGEQHNFHMPLDRVAELIKHELKADKEK